MISPFEVYLVMQLDAIKMTLDTALVMCAMGALILGTIWWVVVDHMHHDEDDRENEARMKKNIKRMLFMWLFLATLNSVLPSTKTAAAMIIMPALTSEKVVDEASELYRLAKDALRDSLDLKEEKKTTPDES